MGDNIGGGVSEAGITEGDYTEWALQYIVDYPASPGGGWDFSWFIDAKNELISFFIYDTDGDYRLGIYMLGDFSKIYLSPSGQDADIAAAGWYVEWLVPGFLGMHSAYQGYFSRSLVQYHIILDKTWDESYLVYKNGSHIDTIEVKNDVASLFAIGGSWCLEGFEISPDGKWIVVSTYDPAKVLVYKGSKSSSGWYQGNLVEYSSEELWQVENPADGVQLELTDAGYPRAGQSLTPMGYFRSVGVFLDHVAPGGSSVYYRIRIRRASDDEILYSKSANLHWDWASGRWCVASGLWVPAFEAVRISAEISPGQAATKRIWVRETGNEITGNFCKFSAGSWAEVDASDLRCKWDISRNPAFNAFDGYTTRQWRPSPANEPGAWISWATPLEYASGVRLYIGDDVLYRPQSVTVYGRQWGDAEWTELVTGSGFVAGWNVLTFSRRSINEMKLVINEHGANGSEIYEIEYYYE